MFRSFRFIPALLFALAAPANAGPFEDGLAAYEQKDYPTALKVLKPLAELERRADRLNLFEIPLWFDL